MKVMWMNSIIKFSNVSKTYPKGVCALSRVSFELNSGGINALLGPNGSGKTTILRIIATISMPSAGEVTIFGENIKHDIFTIRQQIGYVAQNISVDRYANVKQNLYFAARLYHVPNTEIETRVNELLERFSLKSHMNATAKLLSIGMQRRLDLAMALIHKPKILLLDEPTVSLDPKSRKEVWESIQLVKKYDDVTVLFSTHYLEEADQYADRILFIDQGKLVEDGSPSELKKKVGVETIKIAFENKISASQATRILSKLFDQNHVVVVEEKLLVSMQNASEKIKAVADLLKEARIQYTSIAISEPSLDDVYMLLTGRSFDFVNAKGERTYKNQGA